MIWTVFWSLYFVFGVYLVFKFFDSILNHPTDEERENYSIEIYYIREHPFISTLIALFFVVISPTIWTVGYIIGKVQELIK